MSQQPITHWVPTRFRNLTDDQLGVIQHRLLDLEHAAVDVAADYKISSATVYRVKNCVPADLVTIDEDMLRKLRKRKTARKLKKVS